MKISNQILSRPSHERNQNGAKVLLLASLLAIFALGCASTNPRVLEVSSRTRLRNIDKADERLFVRDAASGFRSPSKDLPAEAQGEEFYVRWTPSTVGLVKFEYRQVEKPNLVLEKTYTPQGDQTTVFAVRGSEFHPGGPVSAWRVSLWNGDQLLAEKLSALW